MPSPAMHGPFLMNSVVSIAWPILVMLLTLVEWMMAVWRKPCSCVLGLGDRLVDVAAADEGQEGHHLLDRHEGVRFVGLAEEQFAPRARSSCRSPGPARRRPCR